MTRATSQLSIVHCPLSILNWLKLSIVHCPLSIVNWLKLSIVNCPLSIVLLLPFFASAQLATGSWKLFPVFGDVSHIIETPHSVYYLSEGNLYSYDKEHEETRAYAGQGDLSDTGISDIYYNFAGGYLLVAYTNANIDLLYDNGTRINLPDIKGALLNVRKDINDVKFSNGEIYVATPFGLVVYSDTRHEVKQSGNYGKEVTSLAVTANHILVTVSGDDKALYAAKRGSRINNFSAFIPVGTAPDAVAVLHTLDSDAERLLAVGTSGKLSTLTLEGDTPAITATPVPGYSSVTAVIPTPSATYFRNANTLCRIDAQGAVTEECVLYDRLQPGVITTLKGASSIWSGNTEGVAEYKVDGSNVTVLHDRYRPEGALSFGNICKLFPLPDKSGFIATNLGMNQKHPQGLNEGDGIVFKANVITPGAVEIRQPVYTNDTPLINPTFAIYDPDDPSIGYYGTGRSGVIVTRDDKEIGRFTTSNSKMWTNRASHAVLDSKGNLWVGVFTAKTSAAPIAVLPAENRRKGVESITADDWVRPSLGEYVLSKDVRMVVCENSNACIVFDSQYSGGIVGYNHGGTITDTSDDRYTVHNPLHDTDGRSFTPSYFYCGVEDRRGRVWLGTSMGVVEVTRPEEAANSNFAIKRIKVPRSDGSNLADYLLENEEVYAMAVDASNRKWLGTRQSGLFLVSEDGDEIIANYTTENSLLPTNTITSIYADPNSNSVYVGTLSGLLEFATTSSPGRPDFSDVYAYPNPLTPGYTGWVTITGLMDNSNVKIVDASMHLVYQTVSEGGMALWDGCTINGERVRSGVYYVLASADSSGSTEGDVVTKILVVN